MLSKRHRFLKYKMRISDNYTNALSSTVSKLNTFVFVRG